MGRTTFTGSRVHVAVALVLTAFASSGAWAESIHLSELQPDDVVVAKMWAWGCFHYRAKYEFIFRPNPDRPGQVVVCVKDLRGLLHTRLGVLSLGAEELRGLDTFLAAYREPPGGCLSTTSYRFRLKLVREGEVVAEEMHGGGSCIASTVAGGLSLPEIAAKLGAEGPRAETDGYVRPNNRLKPSAGGGLAAD